MPEQLPFTALLNRIFAGPVAAALTALGIHPKYPGAPISNAVAMQVLVVLLLTFAFVLVRMRLSVDRPGKLQLMAEAIHGFMSDMAHEIIGHDYKKFVPYLTAVGLFILTCNLIG